MVFPNCILGRYRDSGLLACTRGVRCGAGGLCLARLEFAGESERPEYESIARSTPARMNAPGGIWMVSRWPSGNTSAVWSKV